MPSKHARTLAAIFESPPRKNIKWADVAALVAHHGGTVSSAGGSPHTLRLNGARAVLHKPHPGNELKEYQVKLLREFLAQANIAGGSCPH